MADHFPGKIELGGTVVIETIEQRELVEKALSAFANYCSHEWGGTFYGTMSIEDAMNSLDSLGLLEGVDDEARYGEFEEVEDACREAGIAYDRHSSARYEHDAEVSRWRTGMDEAFVTTSKESGNPTFCVSEVKELIEKTLDNETHASLADRISLFKQALTEMSGENIPPLKPLNIIDKAPKTE